MIIYYMEFIVRTNIRKASPPWWRCLTKSALDIMYRRRAELI